MHLPLFRPLALPESPQEMAWYARAHVRRVVRLTQALLAAHPAAFAGVEPGLATRFAALHDRSKTARDHGFLTRHGLREPFAISLHALFGRSAGPRERDVIDRMNQVDERIAAEFFRRHAIPTAVARRYERLVHIADLVDRGMDETSRHHEMGRILEPASHVLAEAEDRVLAAWLEREYSQLVTATERFAALRVRLRLRTVTPGRSHLLRSPKLGLL
jgi:hypothetical protein